MNPELTEEGMGRALFGKAGVSAPTATSATREPVPEVVILTPARLAAKKDG